MFISIQTFLVFNVRNQAMKGGKTHLADLNLMKERISRYNTENNDIQEEAQITK